jgi:Uma2 family endonuclease
MSAAVRLATVADLVRAEMDGFAAEIVDGTLQYKAMGTWAHATIQGTLREQLGPARRHGGPGGGWWILTECDVVLADDQVYRPDIAGWRRERVPVPPAGFPFPIAPDWVCEVLSPSTAARDLGPKLGGYLRAEVGHYWVVDPQAVLLSVYRRSDAGYLLVATATRGQRVALEPFHDLVLDLDDLFDTGEGPPSP